MSLNEFLPTEFRGSLPTIEEIEAELAAKTPKRHQTKGASMTDTLDIRRDASETDLDQPIRPRSTSPFILSALPLFPR